MTAFMGCCKAWALFWKGVPPVIHEVCDLSIGERYCTTCATMRAWPALQMPLVWERLTGPSWEACLAAARVAEPAQPSLSVQVLLMCDVFALHILLSCVESADMFSVWMHLDLTLMAAI
jgi:hypothetical protein